MFGRLLEINLSEKSFAERGLSEREIMLFLGGKGMGAYLLYKELKGADPLSEENLLIFLTGPLTGTPFPASGRMVVITKSPLTGLFLDSHAGGRFGPELRKAGYDGLIIRGKADIPVYIWIEDENIEIRDAREIWGLGIEGTVEKIRLFTRSDASVACIGPAGENLVRFATISFDKDSDPFRAGIAGRGGAGAVMGSKHLKAIAVKGSGRVKLYEENAFRRFSSRLMRVILDNDFIHTRRVIGTSYWVDPVCRNGILPSYNFKQGFITPVYGLLGTNLRYYAKRDVSCFNCPIACGKVMKVKDGRDVKVEYESIALLGSNDGIDNIKGVAEAIYLCNEFGLDSISTGVVVGFAMECSEKGLLSEAPSFGDLDGQLSLIKDIAYRRGIGDLLAEGVRRASERLGRETQRFAMHVKGLEIPGYEPRSSWGMALAYATSDRGACHQRAWTVRAEMDGGLRRFSTEGVADFVKEVQDERAVAFSLIVCDFLPISVEDMIEALRLSIGISFSEEEYLKVGERVWNLVRLFNIREAGIERKDDILPPRVFEEGLPLPPRGERKAKLPKEAFDKMLDEYYKLRGWNANGIPEEWKVRELSLDGL
ncbi:MAG: aldehyde ferredoxin oxidoreductase family protein [Synergistetes bacterium]|nr:aldehyde ferredoxin oxidoreductase family protein [Synergistota bacterium]